MSSPSAKTPAWLGGWVALGSFLSCAGWLLSAFGHVDAMGYLVVLIVGAIAVAVWWRKGGGRQFRAPGWGKICRRFRRPFPMAFLILAAMAFLGGVLYPPNNYDALAYRIPRLLHWLADGRWNWVHTVFNRLNTRGTGFEWMAAPVMVFTKTDRWLWLINVVCFWLLPGMFFSVLTRLGVRRRAAWYRMWLLPTGYSYLLQSASLGNDLFGATFGLAALDLALRARTSKSFPDIWLSILAAAMVSGSKLSNLPLLLPWLIAFLPSLRLLKDRLLSTAAIGAAALLCSFLPMAIANVHYCGDWTGFAAEGCPFGKPDHVLHLEHNTLLMLEQNFAPPIFPFSKQWNALMAKLISPERRKRLEANFEPGQAHLVLDEMQMEEGAGLGFGVSLLLVISVPAAWFLSRSGKGEAAPAKEPLRIPILLGSWIALGAYMAESGLATEARLGTPYYAFVVPLFLLGRAQSLLTRARWWRVCALLVYPVAAILLVMIPARPLWPAQTILGHVQGNSPLLNRARRVYAVYADRSDCFAPARQYLPPDFKVIGLISFDFPETSLWRPFGTRRVENIEPSDTFEYMHQHDVQYILVNYEEYRQSFPLPFDQWLAQIHGEYVRNIPLDLRAREQTMDWRLVRIKD